MYVKNHMRQQQVYFDHAVTGCPTMRTFDIHNVWTHPLLFDMEADTPDIRVRVSVGVRVCFLRT